MNLKNIFISNCFIILSIIVFTLLFSTLNYYNLMKDGLFNIIKILIPIFSIFVFSFKLGKKSSKKGWLEGIKCGSIIILFLIIISLIFFNNDLSIKSIFYYLILLSSSIVAAMIGINFKKVDNN